MEQVAGGAGDPFLGKSCWDIPNLINGTVEAIRAEPAQQEAAPGKDNLLFLGGGGVVLMFALIPVSPVVPGSFISSPLWTPQVYVLTS